MNWLPLTNETSLYQIKELSYKEPQLLFKHSVTCSISKMVLSRMEREVQPNGVACYYLDLLAHRNISNTISELFGVQHESPQVLLIKNGECIYHESHHAIYMNDILAHL